MNIYRKDVEEVGEWFVFVLYLLALGYIGAGERNILIILFAVVFSAYVIVGFIEGIVKVLKDYYSKKKGAPRQ
jgi:hypothetical protein